MNTVLKVVLSLSLSGSLLILPLFLSKIFMKNRTSKRWQYYIWLVVIARLLLPFTPEISAVGTLFQWVEETISSSESEPGFTPGAYVNPASEFTNEPAESSPPNQESDLSVASAPSIKEIGTSMIL